MSDGASVTAASTAVTIPGLMHWHAALVVLTPGLVALGAALAVLILPPGRGRIIVARCAVVLAGLLGLLGLSAAYRGGWSTVAYTWVHAWPVMVLGALLVAIHMSWTRRGDAGLHPARWCALSGAAFLAVLWCPPWSFCAALADTTGRRRQALMAVMILGSAACWLAPPAAIQCVAAVLIAWLIPAWRMVAAGAAGAGLWSLLFVGAP